MLVYSKGICEAIQVSEIAHAIVCDQIGNFIAENYVFVISYPNIPHLTFLMPSMIQK